MADIKFNYNQTINQAKLLDELANDMTTKCVKKIAEIEGNIEAAWTGSASKAFIKYISDVEDSLSKKAKYLRDVAEFLRSAAKKMQAAEAAANQAAQNV